MFGTGVHIPSSRDSNERLVMRYKSPPQSRARGNRSNLMKPNFTGANFEDSLSAWDSEIRRYGKETVSKLPIDLKIAVTMNDTK